MTDEPKYTWVPFYEEFANKLLEYETERTALIAKLESAFNSEGLEPPKWLGGSPWPEDIDPFTVYKIFNIRSQKGQQTDDKRKEIIEALRIEFSIEAPQPSDFDGVPRIDNRNYTTFYLSTHTSENTNFDTDIKRLWREFIAGIKLADYGRGKNDENYQEFIEAFNDAANNIKYVAGGLTEGLFWIRPSKYLSLDDNNKELLEKLGDTGQFKTLKAFDNTKKNAEKYLQLCDEVRGALNTGMYPYHSFPEFSFAAYFSPSDKEPACKNPVGHNTPRNNTVNQSVSTSIGSYHAEEFLSEVYLNQEEYEKLVGLLEYKKNIILQGAPGVGKTYAARRLAYSMMGTKDQSRVMMVQFHQSYSYEDFVEGYRPMGDGGFKLAKGSFYSFCKKAKEDPTNSYFFIIDEINRGNLSKIFGELFMLIESDKRGSEYQVPLLYSQDYSQELFYVPKNLYLIGTMNTADRSLAMLDYALRRRFAFVDVEPAFRNESFIKYQKSLESEGLNKLIKQIQDLNDAIENDPSLGKGFRIGHSYFCNLDGLNKKELESRLFEIVEYELIPMLDEYWFDDADKAKEWAKTLSDSIG